MKCPVCGKKSQHIQCPDCGFDSSRDYECFPTLTPLAEGLPSREIFGNGIKNLVRCGTCGGLYFRIDLIAAKLYCRNCGGETDLQIKGSSRRGHTSLQTYNRPWRKNVLRSDEVNTNGLVENPEKCPVLGSKFRRKQIRSVTFLESLAEAPKNAWDVSKAGDGKVLAWVIPNGKLYDLYIGAEGGISAGESCRELFCGYINLRQILNLDFLHTEKVQDVDQMFCECRSLTSLDLTGFDTSCAQSMSEVFFGCTSLRSLDLSGFDTSHVQNMSGMFFGCTSLRSLNFCGFDTSHVQDMAHMFSGCTSLRSLDLSGFDTGSVQSMGEMFSDCSNLTSLDLHVFDTSNLQYTYGMFSGCKALERLDLSSFDTSNVQYTLGMFDDCPAGRDWQHLLK